MPRSDEDGVYDPRLVNDPKSGSWVIAVRAESAEQ
jgi:hypothetical protein